MQLKRNKEMEFETLKKSYKKQIIIGAITICIIGGALTFKLTRAKYKITESIPLVKGNVSYSVPDMRVVAVNISEDGTNYTNADEIPTTGYSLNIEKSMCKVATNSIANAPKDNNITIEYTDGKINFLGVTKQSTRCYLYFDKKDEEPPTITNVTTSVTKTEINVTVTATDNEGVTEYWYQLNSNTPVKQTTNTYKFTGLTAGTTYSVKVYVKDKAGNQSTTTTKSVTTSSPTSEDTLTKLNITSYKTTKPTFSSPATTDEGVYRVSDGMYGGYSYYWRGAVTTNHVIFANKCWRIVRINGDGSVRLIYNGTLQSRNTCIGNGVNNDAVIRGATNAENYYATSDGQYINSSYVGWTYTLYTQRTTGGTASNAKTQTEKWYDSNIGNNATYTSKVDTSGKFCNDRNVGTAPSIWGSGYVTTWSARDIDFAYAGGKRLYESYAPILSCPSGDVYSLKVGAITADEVEFAGGKNESNELYYLYTGDNYWTMTPARWYNSYAHVFDVNWEGSLDNGWVSGNAPGLRPVINLRSDVTFSGGNGTQSNPYVVQ